jgi:hypothetical protein
MCQTSCPDSTSASRLSQSRVQFLLAPQMQEGRSTLELRRSSSSGVSSRRLPPNHWVYVTLSFEVRTFLLKLV